MLWRRQQRPTQKKAADSNIVKELASKQKDSAEYTQALNDLLDRVNTAYTLQNKALFNSQVKKVAGQDSEIELNGVKYTGDSNSYSINGLTIEALAETGDSAISITTSTDTQGVYDKVKDFLTEYNNIINEMTKLYNADSAGSYEPLTDDEKDQMSDKEIEKWETKIKDSLLRRDSTLGSVMTAMQTAMMSSVEIGGKKYSLSSFGISTLGFLNAAENEQNAYHIDGDEDDANTSGKTDKLMAAINDDPDTVMQFMQQLFYDHFHFVHRLLHGVTFRPISIPALRLRLCLLSQVTIRSPIPVSPFNVSVLRPSSQQACSSQTFLL